MDKAHEQSTSMQASRTLPAQDQKAPFAGLRVVDLVKVYKAGPLEVLALRGLSLEVPLGKVVIIMGPSGCGKTTLLHLIGGLDVPTAGTVQFNCHVITKLAPQEVETFRRDNVGFVFQFMNLMPILSAAENIALPLKIAGQAKREIGARVEELLKLVHLENRRDHKPEELSGGEQQRVAIATALAHDPALLLCDEPTGELDSENKREVMALLRSLVSGHPDKILLVVTHDPEMQDIADIVLHIRDGAIYERIEGADLAALKDARQAGKNGGAQVAAAQVQELKDALREMSKKVEQLGNSL